jgi:hypothetical protein
LREGGVVLFGAVGGTGIRRHRHEIADIGPLSHGVLDTLMGDNAHDHQLRDAEVSQDVVEIGRPEGAGRGLLQHDVVGPGCDGVDHLRRDAARRQVDPRDLVVDASVTPVAGEALDHDVDRLGPATADRGVKPLLVRNRHLRHRLVEMDRAGRPDPPCRPSASISGPQSLFCMSTEISAVTAGSSGS